MIPQDGTSVSTEQLLSIIGELTVQVRVLQQMLRNNLEKDLNGAVEERSLQSKDN